MAFIVNDLVDIRPDGNTGWFPGTVTAVNDRYYTVDLDTPTAATTIYGSVPSKYAANQNMTTFRITKCTEFVGNAYIRTQV